MIVIKSERHRKKPSNNLIFTRKWPILQSHSKLAEEIEKLPVQVGVRVHTLTCHFFASDNTDLDRSLPL